MHSVRLTTLPFGLLAVAALPSATRSFTCRTRPCFRSTHESRVTAHTQHDVKQRGGERPCRTCCVMCLRRQPQAPLISPSLTHLYAPCPHTTLSFPPLKVGGNVVETLLPFQTCIYSWDEPLGDRSLIVERLLVEGYLAAAAAAATGRGSSSGQAAPRAFVGVYGLDLMRPSTVAGNMRVGATRGLGDVSCGGDGEVYECVLVRVRPISGSCCLVRC